MDVKSRIYFCLSFYLFALVNSQFAYATDTKIKFKNELAINAHTFLVDVASGKREIPLDLLGNEKLAKAVKGYSAMVREPRFHLLFSNNDVSKVTSKLMLSEPLDESDCPNLCDLLITFIPIYEQTIWKSVEQLNRQWIQTTTNLIDQYGDEVESALNQHFKTKIIPSTHVIFVVENIDRGATTSGRSPITIISSAHPQFQTFNSLEMVFHEIVHTYATSRKSVFRRLIKNTFSNSKSAFPSDLWHLVHFYTVGFVTEKVLSDREVVYKSYAKSYGLYEGRWAKSFALVKKHWTQYLEGKRNIKQALENIKDDANPS